jgi:hypothetical protein
MLESGMVWVNSSNDTDFRVPFGSIKQSGIGRELGEAGLTAYLRTKAIHEYRSYPIVELLNPNNTFYNSYYIYGIYCSCSKYQSSFSYGQSQFIVFNGLNSLER